MERYAGFWALLAVGAFIVLIVSRLDERGSLPALEGRYSEARDPAVAVGDDGARELLIPRGPGGSYVTRVTVDGAVIPVLIDTGASFVTLRQSDAARAGVIVSEGDFTKIFSTANGEVRAARARVNSMQVGPGRIENVTIFVLPDDKLSISLLGMNALSRFGRIEFSADGVRVALD